MLSEKFFNMNWKHKYLDFFREKHFKCWGSISEPGSLLKHIPIIIGDLRNNTLEGKITKYKYILYILIFYRCIRTSNFSLEAQREY